MKLSIYFVVIVILIFVCFFFFFLNQHIIYRKEPSTRCAKGRLLQWTKQSAQQLYIGMKHMQNQKNTLSTETPPYKVEYFVEFKHVE